MVSTAAGDGTALVAEVLAKHWRIREPALRTDLGVSRLTWRVGRQYWLSQSEAWRSTELIPQAEMLHQLRRFLVEKRRAISVPEMVPSENGRHIVTDNGYLWCLTRHLPGFHPDSRDPDIYPVLIEGLAGFHHELELFSRDQREEAPYGICVRTRQCIERLRLAKFAPFTNHPREHELLEQTRDWLLPRLVHFEALPRQLIHGDWTPRNVLFASSDHGAHLSGVLDFEAMAQDPVHVDLANTCSTLLMWSGLDRIEERICNVLNTYERFSEVCLERVDVYTAMLAHWFCHYWSWRDRLEGGGFGQNVKERLCLRIASVLDFVCSVSGDST